MHRYELSVLSHDPFYDQQALTEGVKCNLHFVLLSLFAPSRVSYMRVCYTKTIHRRSLPKSVTKLLLASMCIAKVK
jgi:hypothetical protein